MAAAATAAEPEASRSGDGAGSADSYIGSLISLTSKCEIRYEGVLFNINTKESSIGLKNVRSFGTEGRKKDGPQIPPSDKVYEYILFRGSDIKDLQVKSSPPVQSTPPMHDDPAIIQSHYSRTASLSMSMPSIGSVTVADGSSHTTQPGLQRPTFQGGLPLHQSGGSFGSWGTSPGHPSANGSGLPLPMYWQGFYGPSGGLPHVQQQQPLFRPPPGLPIPHSMLPQMQYPGMNPPPPTGSSNLPEAPSPLLPVGTNSNQSLTLATLPPTLPPIQAAPLPSEMSLSLMPNKALISSLPMTTPSLNLPVASLLTSSMDTSATPAPVSSRPLTVPGLTLPYQPTLQSVPGIGRTSASSQAETSLPSLLTPNQLIWPVPSPVSSVQPLETVKDAEVVQLPSTAPSTSAPVPSEARGPLLPLPTLSDPKLNAAALQTCHSNRVQGRGRANEISYSTAKFTEEFDFIAMNEKFKKDEVWGDLSRNKTQSKDGIANDGDADDTQEEGDTESSYFEVKPVYVKDDFFDTLSCNALGRGTRNGRTRFSERMKIDTETFGDVSRHRGWGGRGPGHGGRSRGGYYGRGYGYAGRGRSQTMSNRAN